MKSYRQLTLDERYQVQSLFALGHSRSQIAERLGRHRSSIGREIRRNWPTPNDWAQTYTALKAQEKTRHRRIQKGKKSQKIRGILKDLVEGKLRLGWSPEQISGRLRLEEGLRLSAETIYQHVLRETHSYPDPGQLRYCLRFGGYKQHRFKKSKCALRTRGDKNWLDQRPQAANDRSELGHWERDRIEGKRGKASLLTLVDRKSRYVQLKWVSGPGDASEVGVLTSKALSPFKSLNRSLTNDNGREHSDFRELQNILGIKIFFTDPSSPWQRGTVENTNGLLRQYFRKRTPLEDYPRWFPQALEQTLNHRPRKTLQYRTPHEIFFGKTMSLMSGRWLRLGLEFGGGGSGVKCNWIRKEVS